jgi:hypothetical protein
MSKGAAVTQLQQPASATDNYSGAAVGLTVFASVMMLMIGTFQVFAGMAALINDQFYVVGEEWVFQFDTTTWGWIHLLMGAVVFLAGLALYAGQVWARTVGVILAVVSAAACFAWLPYYPVWAVIIIALNVSVIWALTAHGRDLARA